MQEMDTFKEFYVSHQAMKKRDIEIAQMGNTCASKYFYLQLTKDDPGGLGEHGPVI